MNTLHLINSTNKRIVELNIAKLRANSEYHKGIMLYEEYERVITTNDTHIQALRSLIKERGSL